MEEDYYIAMLIKSGLQGTHLLMSIKKNIEGKFGAKCSFVRRSDQNSKEAAVKYYYYKNIIKEKGEQYLYEQIMRTYNTKTNIRLFGNENVRGSMRSSKS
jgi:hypothetical protein